MRFRLNLGLVILLMPFLTSAYLFSTPPMSFCKCLCFGTNSTILPLYLPKDPLAPCLTCTRQFCLDQKLGICLGAKSGEEDLDTGKGESGDVEARCFRALLLPCTPTVCRSYTLESHLTAVFTVFTVF